MAILAALAVVLVPGLYTLFVSSLPLDSGSTGIGRVLKAEIGKYCITLSLLIGIFVSIKDLNPMIFFISLLVLYFSPALLPFLTSTDKDKFLLSIPLTNEISFLDRRILWLQNTKPQRIIFNII